MQIFWIHITKICGHWWSSCTKFHGPYTYILANIHTHIYIRLLISEHLKFPIDILWDILYRYLRIRYSYHIISLMNAISPSDANLRGKAWILLVSKTNLVLWPLIWKYSRAILQRYVRIHDLVVKRGAISSLFMKPPCIILVSWHLLPVIR